MIEDVCAIIVQAAAFAAAEILHKEESSVSSRAGRIAVVRVRRSVHDVSCCLGSSYFQRAYRMSYKKFWNYHSKLATRINRARLAMRHYVSKGGQKGVNLSCHPYKMGELRQVFVLHVPFNTLPGVPHMIS
jgi:hypothetical protein